MNFSHLFSDKLRPQNADEHWMALAITLATKGYGFTKPNPMVGAVLLSEQKQILGQGFHPYLGGKHAEVVAIEEALQHTSDLSKTTLYCTLEPCCHENKKTPPCLAFILKHKIKRVVIGITDPNPLVAGKSISALKAAGVEVSYGILEKDCRYLIRQFSVRHRLNRPYFHLKMAITLDGSFGVATSPNTPSPWFTNSIAKNYVHFLRAGADGILVGGNTFRMDRPQLNCRLSPFQETSSFQHPQKWIMTQQKNSSLERSDFHLIHSLSELKNLDHQEILIEAGPNLQSQFLEQGIFDEISIILAPILIGNQQKLKISKNNSLIETLNLSNGQWISLGDNLLFHWIGCKA